MKLNKNFEQAIYVITMLALQEDHRPVKSQVLSQVLQVSDSYLKKTLMKLARAGLIESNASKAGGYQLARPVTDMTLKDIFFALDLQSGVVEFQHVAHQVYEDKVHVQEVEDQIRTTLEKGLEAFFAQLDTLKISDLLHQEAYEQGAIDWNQKV